MSEKEEPKYVVEKILDEYGSGENLYYQVKWDGYNDPKDITWEPAANLRDCQAVIKKYNAERGSRAKSSITKQQLSYQESKKRRSKSIGGKMAMKESKKENNHPSEGYNSIESFDDGYRIKNCQSKAYKNRPSTSKEDSKVLFEMINKSQNNDDTNDDQSSKHSTPIKKSRNDSKTPDSFPQAFKAFIPTPLSEIDPLRFKVTKIECFYDDGIFEKVIVRTEDNERKIVYLKAVALQNLDLVMDYFTSRIQRANNSFEQKEYEKRD